MLFFAYFRVSLKRNIKRSPNGMKPSGELFLERKQSRRLGVYVRKSTRLPRGRGARPPPGHALHPRGALIAPPTYFFLLYMSIYPPKYPGARRKPNSTTATFCTREIPSWGLFESSVGGGIDHTGPLHQLHGLSGDV